MAKNILQSTSPNLIGEPNTELLDQNSFSALIWNKGYDVIIEQAISCPCKGETGNNQSTCQNCLGFGWVFIDPLQTKAILTGINRETKYRNWSPELLGTIAVTVRESERLSFMDKITLPDHSSIMSESQVMRTVGGQSFIFCSYPPKTINHIFYWKSNTEKLVRLPSSAYSISENNPYIILIDNSYTFESGFNGALSVDYKHDIQYHVIDLPHDFRAVHVPDLNGIQQENALPMQAIARRTHYVIDQPTTLAGDNIFDNSTR